MEEALDLSFDRLLMTMVMMIPCIMFISPFIDQNLFTELCVLDHILIIALKLIAANDTLFRKLPFNLKFSEINQVITTLDGRTPQGNRFSYRTHNFNYHESLFTDLYFC